MVLGLMWAEKLTSSQIVYRTTPQMKKKINERKLKNKQEALLMQSNHASTLLVEIV